MKNKKKIIIFILVFLYFLVLNLIFNKIQMDETWNYGFAHNIYNGLIPYKDFNMVITPFYPFIMSLPFHIFGSSMLVFQIENALMLTIMMFLIYEYLKDINKFNILVIYMLLLTSTLLFPTYNLFLLFLTVLLLLLEEKNGNDYLIGLILGIAFLTKQSVGICLILVSLYYFRDWRKLLKRLVGILIPCFIFLIVLLCTKSFMPFIDYCVLGLFEFGEKNFTSFSIWHILCYLYFIVCIILIIKDRKNIDYYYALAFGSMVIPLLDHLHFRLTFIILLMVILKKYNVKKVFKYGLMVGILMIYVPLYSFYSNNKGLRIEYPNTLRHYEYRYLESDYLDFARELDKKLEKYSDKKIEILNVDAYFYRLIHDEEITPLDLINEGNLGYNGTEKTLDYIKSHKDHVYLIAPFDLTHNQTNKTVLKYVINNAKKVDSIDIYDVYIFEDKD